MQRLFVIALAAVIVLAVGFCVLIFVSLIPHFALIGLAATGVVLVLLGCIAILIIAFTWTQIGIWEHRRQTIVAGEVVAYIDRAGEIVHLSAEHEQAKAPQQAVRALPEPKAVTDPETVLELHKKGATLRTIVEATGLKYHEVQKITSQKQ